MGGSRAASRILPTWRVGPNTQCSRAMGLTATGPRDPKAPRDWVRIVIGDGLSLDGDSNGCLPAVSVAAIVIRGLALWITARGPMGTLSDEP